MEESKIPVWSWTVRRAELIDVPAVARLLGAPIPTAAQWRAESGLSDQTLTSATRLVLTHVALSLGEFWVAADADNRIRAAVVVLPPGRRRGQIMDDALRLELGLLPDALPVANRSAGLPDLPQQHWLLLMAAAPDDEQVLRELIDAALPAIDADGGPVLCLQPGPPPRVLFEVGFRVLASEALTTEGATDEAAAGASTGSASLRPGARSPVGV